MATDHKGVEVRGSVREPAAVVGAASRVRASSARQEEEVYGMLGALLGTLEVVASDDEHRVSDAQLVRLKNAVRICYRLQHQVEALLTLAADEVTLRLHDVQIRPMLEHALRGAVRSFESRAVELHLPEGEHWGERSVNVDRSRVDRMLKALAEALAGSVGQAGAIDVTLYETASTVEVELTGRVGTKLTGKQLVPEATLQDSTLLMRGAQRLFEVLGGSLLIDVDALRVRVGLPASEAP